MYKSLNIDGYKINYKIVGNGTKTVAILQGWGTEMSLYDSIADVLKEKFTVIQLDLPGFGSSDEPKEPWSVSDYCSIFVKFMEVLGIKETSLIGHSYGGRMIIKIASGKWQEEMAENVPFEIEKIVLIDSAGIMPKRSFTQKLKIRKYKVLKKVLYFKPIYWLYDDIIDDWNKNQGSSDYKMASPVMKASLVKAVNEDLKDLLSRIKEETLLVWGELDDATPLDDGKTMEKLIENSGLVEIKGTGHYSFLENRNVFSNVIKVFFEI